MEIQDEIRAAVLRSLKGSRAHRRACFVERIGASLQLPPLEAQLVAAAIPARQLEFAAGRSCARRALAEVGAAAGPLGIGALREPIWPAGYHGSISHDGRFAVALAYPKEPCTPWLSIDLIDRADLRPYMEVAGIISSSREPWRSLNDARGITQIFSAKEAAIKIFSPLTRRLVDFTEILITRAVDGFGAELTGFGLTVSIRSLDIDGVIVSVGISDPI